MKHRVFVYGTLKRGESKHHLLQGIPGVNAQALGIVLHSGPSYPYAVRGEGKIFGELYTIDSLTLEKLDRLEDHPQYYVRELIPVLLPEGRIITAWIYLNERGRRYPRLAGGFWQSQR